MTAADWSCPECRADPTTAPGRVCAPRRCYCRHASCPATSRAPLAEPLADVTHLPNATESAWMRADR